MKKIRLENPAYSQQGAYCSITICTENRIPVFDDADFVQICTDTLKNLAKKSQFTLIVYCFMPDHVHILLNNYGGNSIIDFARDFKYATTRLAWSHGYEGRIYQQSFHDRFLRSDERLEEVSEYILQNPMRKGLAEHRQKPPFVESNLYLHE